MKLSSYREKKVRFTYILGKKNKKKNNLFPILYLLLKQNWGLFSKTFLINRIVQSDIIVLAKFNNDIVGCSIGKCNFNKTLRRPYYSIELLVVDNNWQGRELSSSLNIRLVMWAFIYNTIHFLRLRVDLIFVTTKINLIHAIIKYSSYTYPNPNDYNVERSTIEPSNEETWSFVREYAAASGERLFRLQRQGSVITKSFDDTPWITIDNEDIAFVSKKFELFSNKYLAYNKKYCNEIIVHSICYPSLIFSYLFK